MKKFTTFALFVCCLVSIGGALTRTASAASSEDQILQRLDALEKENAALRARVNRLEASKATATAHHAAPAPIQPLQNAAALAAVSNTPPQTAVRTVDAATTRPLHHFEISGSLLYLQPGAGDLDYGTLTSPLPVASPDWSNQSLKPGFSPAFDVGVRYIANASDDIELNWTHLDTATGASVAASPTQMVGPPYLTGPESIFYSNGNGTVNFHYDAVNLDGGHAFCAECPFQLRAFGGVEFARIGQDVGGLFQSAAGVDSSGYTNHSLFTGVGPRLGLKGQYAFGDVQLIGEAAAAGLIGTAKSRIDFTTNTAVVGLNNQALTSPDATQLIPSVDARLAAAYTFPPGDYGRFRLELGYQAAIYFNAISQYALTEVTTTAPPVGVFLATEQHSQSNFTNHGPYLTGSWAF
jgi:Legionella pneumophila major outer membrane protein precursor